MRCSPIRISLSTPSTARAVPTLVCWSGSSSAGRIALSGEPVTGPGPDRGLVFQSGAVYPFRTVERNVGFGLELLDLSPAERRRRVDWYLAETGLTAGFALGIAAGLGALGQGKAVAAAVEAIARNPSATTDIRGSLLLGLVLIESLVIYVLLISLILLFLFPFGK